MIVYLALFLLFFQASHICAVIDENTPQNIRPDRDSRVGDKVIKVVIVYRFVLPLSDSQLPVVGIPCHLPREGLRDRRQERIDRISDPVRFPEN